MAEAPVGEDSWLALVDEASRTASNLEQRVGVVELYKQAIAAEPSSTKLWLAYGEWFWSLYTDCQTTDAGWPEEEQIYGQELFALDVARDVWQQGAQATQYRLNDSHELWNRWMSIELGELSKARDSKSMTQQDVNLVRRMFIERLQIPQATWDETSQMFSTFLTNYDEASYESSMVQITQLAKDAKKLYSDREISELKLRRAAESGDIDAQKAAMKEYLEWESKQAKLRKKHAPVTPLDLCVALYERALSSTAIFGLESEIWLDYIVFLSRTKRELPQAQLPTVLSVIQRAVSHCPWSGELWSRYILRAETENVAHSDIELIKHAATDNKALDRDGMESVVDVYVAWCGYLKRRTLVPGATEEDMDVAEMGLHTALESVQDWGEKHDKNYKGDPLFRIERILIQLLTQKGSIQDARGFWKGLIHANASSYDFWQQYYLWEISVRMPNAPPSLATEVLIKAVHQESLDWPEKLLEVYVRHCINFAESEAVDVAMDIVHERKKAVAKRRAKEQEEAAAAYYAQQQSVSTDAAVDESPSSASKRKRETSDDELDGNASKKVKGDRPEPDHAALREQHQKRDRENTSVMVTNLPPGVTQTKIRQYFKDYGHINSLNTEDDGEGENKSTTALIEFRSNDDVQSALIRDGKYFNDRQIGVKAATGLTLYVTNFPPEADDYYFRELFKDCGQIFSIRRPSLKYNAHRRFCYISFRTAEDAAAAVQLDGTMQKGGYKLSVAHSDPSRKKAREGATAEGREVHVTSLDNSLTEEDLKEVFAKYGVIETVRIMRNKGGESKGGAFVVFEKKEEAEASLDLDKTKLKSKILKVELATGKNYKPTAISKGASASPAPDANRGSVMSPSPMPEAHAGNAPTRDEIAKRTITLMNVPDIVNDARIRVLAEPFGTIVKVVLRPDHQGAIIEYTDIASAGRAALALENHEIVPGRKLRTGGMKDLFGERDEIKTDRIQVGQGKKAAASFLKPTAPVRRPGVGGRGGLGQKRGLGFSKAADSSVPSAGTGDVNGDAKEGNAKPKSNADFKAMFVSSEK
jgi:RNA recognition motif-containing protein